MKKYVFSILAFFTLSFCFVEADTASNVTKTLQSIHFASFEQTDIRLCEYIVIDGHIADLEMQINLQNEEGSIDAMLSHQQPAETQLKINFVSNSNHYSSLFQGINLEKDIKAEIVKALVNEVGLSPSKIQVTINNWKTQHGNPTQLAFSVDIDEDAFMLHANPKLHVDASMDLHNASIALDIDFSDEWLCLFEQKAIDFIANVEENNLIALAQINKAAEKLASSIKKGSNHAQKESSF